MYHLTNGDIRESQSLLKHLKPSSPLEYIVKGVVYAAFGQFIGDRVALMEAMTHFDVVGQSPTEKDTIPGRQCMASLLFLQKKYSDAMFYLDSIKEYLCKLLCTDKKHRN